MVTLKPARLTKEAFAPFGDVLTVGDGGKSMNQGTAVRFDWCAKLESSRPGAKANLVMVRSTPKTLPFPLALVEHHPGSSQTFIPLSCTRYLVTVCPPLASGQPDLEKLQSFICLPGEGINYHRGVWHHPILALDGPAEFAMLVWEDGTAQDTVEVPLARGAFEVRD